MVKILLIFDALLICCSNDSQRYEWKVMSTEQTQKNKRKEKTLIWKHDIGLLNFLRNITFTVLATFQTFATIFLSAFRPWTMHNVCFSSSDLVRFWVTYSCL